MHAANFSTLQNLRYIYKEIVKTGFCIYKFVIRVFCICHIIGNWFFIQTSNNQNTLRAILTCFWKIIIKVFEIMEPGEKYHYNSKENNEFIIVLFSLFKNIYQASKVTFFHFYLAHQEPSFSISKFINSRP